MRVLAITIFFLIACMLASTNRGTGVSLVTPSSPFDQYGNICWEDEKARLDNFAIQLQNYPSATGNIIIYAGRQSCRGEARYRANRAKDWVVKRGVESKRVMVIDAGFQSDLTTYLIIRPKGSAPYDTPRSLPKQDVSIKRCVDKVFERVLCLDSR